MKRKNKGRKYKKRKNRMIWMLIILLSGSAITAVYAIKHSKIYENRTVPHQETTPEEELLNYMALIQEQDYANMYRMIAMEDSGQVSEEDFIRRNSAIYEGMEVQNMTVTLLPSDRELHSEYEEAEETVRYETVFDTAAGTVSFENEASFIRQEGSYKLIWTDSLIYPGLSSADKVKVSVTQAKRGEILDRNGYVLAGKGIASSVGIVPGKLENRDRNIKQIAGLLQMKQKDIKKKLAAKWVKDDFFVPVKTLKKIEEKELLSLTPDAEMLKEYERQQKLLEIPGVVISDLEVRSYPLQDAAAHLVGYVQNVTAEDLEEHAQEGYTANSVIGRTGAEALFEKELKGTNGCRIYIVDSDGNEKEELACRMVEDGKNITLTIDAQLQNDFYEQFRNDKSCSVAINPQTGEVLALVSTPSYDNNDFIIGLSDEKWASLNEDENKPMYNRIRQVWCPGSTFKPIIAAIGLESGAVDPDEDYGNVGLSWQKDASWGSYHVTTLHDYEPVVLENALIYSDNIYFAKAALKIGAEKMKDALLQLGFDKELPFDIVMAKSQYSNTENIETEIQLADSGYGQGQILVNPLHLACIYSAFCNQGNVIKPYFIQDSNTEPEYQIAGVFSETNANLVLEAMKKVVNDPHGTGYAAHREDILLAGKTGTAEIKASKEDTTGTELGWFAIFTADQTVNDPILIVSMVEDVKGRGGSGYVVEKDKQVLEAVLERAKN